MLVLNFQEDRILICLAVKLEKYSIMQQATSAARQEEDRGAKINFSNGVQQLADTIRCQEKQKKTHCKTNKQKTQQKPSNHPNKTKKTPNQRTHKDPNLIKKTQSTQTKSNCLQNLSKFKNKKQDKNKQATTKKGGNPN